MQINNIVNINNKTTFKKAIGINEASRDHSIYGEYTNTEKNIAKVLNNEACDEYTKEEKKQIKDFFKLLTNDENGSVVYKHCDEGKFFVFGKEAKDVKALSAFVLKTRELTIPDTDYKQAGNREFDEGQMKSSLATFQRNVMDYVYPKINALLRTSFNRDENQTTLEIINDDPTSSKAKAIIATVKTANGEKETTTLNFSA